MPPAAAPAVRLSTPSLPPAFVEFARRPDRKAPELVPRGFLESAGLLECPESAAHLRWLLQKFELGQDVYLVGPAGPWRRHLVLQVCELINAEVEYIAITRDTTESDLKQRREIRGGRSAFSDSPAVRAALEGRVLILDGIEKAERNVLPTLNNLLENREMSLEDGAYLMSPRRYDLLPEPARGKVLRVSEDFRVVALGLPTQRYAGRALDPPLRSRFQGRFVPPLSPGALQRVLSRAAGGCEGLLPAALEANALAELLESTQPGAFPLPQWRLAQCLRAAGSLAGPLGLEGGALAARQLQRRFPLLQEAFRGHRDEGTRELLRGASEELRRSGGECPPLSFDGVGADGRAAFSLGGRRAALPLAAGPALGAGGGAAFVATPALEALLGEALQDYCAGDHVLLCGAKGSGKSALARRLCAAVGFHGATFSLYRDLGARDLLQRRATDAKGDTTWRDSPLVACARRGGVVVLDGVHRLHRDAAASLQRLFHDGALDLPDGTRLSPHPSFRAVALAEPPTRANAWLNEETMSLFAFHAMPPWPPEGLRELLLRGGASAAAADGLLRARKRIAALARAEKLRGGEHLSRAEDALSPRLLLRTAARLSASLGLREALEDALMLRFAPRDRRAALEAALDEAAPRAEEAPEAAAPPPLVDEAAGVVRFGGAAFRRRAGGAAPHLVPRPVFFGNAAQHALLRRVVGDLSALEAPLLLVGNQGVGKNRVVEEALRLWRAEMEYVQLHRDTSVASLTASPRLEGGRVVYEDAPLVRAATLGRVAVLDEADKAPLEAVVALRSLLADGELLLGDGTLLARGERREAAERSGFECREIHEDFRCIVLANPPGFPFHGNDLYRECGDVFCAHQVPNPDAASERALLEAYAPAADGELLGRVVGAFADLRDLHAKGELQYPFSTREAVAVARHLDRFAEDGVVAAVENVIAFDAYDKELRATLSDVFNAHGIPLPREPGAAPPAVDLADPVPLGDVTPSEVLVSEDRDRT